MGPLASRRWRISLHDKRRPVRRCGLAHGGENEGAADNSRTAAVQTDRSRQCHPVTLARNPDRQLLQNGARQANPQRVRESSGVTGERVEPSSYNMGCTGVRADKRIRKTSLQDQYVQWRQAPDRGLPDGAQSEGSRQLALPLPGEGRPPGGGRGGGGRARGGGL